MMYIYDPNEQPFGLLSNDASTPFDLDGEQWNTVTGYVFTNMFKNGEYQRKMVEKLSTVPPFEALLWLKADEYDKAYAYSIEKAQRSRFFNNKKLSDRLLGIGRSIIVYDRDKTTENFLNAYKRELLLANKNKNVLWDSKVKGTVPEQEAMAVIKGVEAEVTRNPNLSNKLTYRKLLKFKVPVSSDTSEYANHPALSNLNKMVPIVKRMVFDKIYDQQVEDFKNHLLDKQLDGILREDYPDIKEKHYAKAKKEQMAEQTPEKIQAYKDQLFEMYESDKLDDALKSKLEFFPDKKLMEIANVEVEAEEVEEEEDIGLVDEDPFLPHFMEEVNVDGKFYRSCVHYGYFVLFGMIDRTDIDVNQFDDVTQLVELFPVIEKEWVMHKLTTNNERAQTAKFSDPALAQLLLLTGTGTLVWDDIDDPILGSKGENRAGIMMTFLRSIAIPSTRPITNFATNAYFSKWIIMRCNDYKVALSMINDPTTEDLLKIYMCPILMNRSLEVMERKLIKMFCRLSDKKIDLISPLLVYQLNVLFEMNEGEAISSIVQAQLSLNEKSPTTNDKNYAKKILGKVFKELSSKIEISKEEFVDNMLRDSTNRINYWGS